MALENAQPLVMMLTSISPANHFDVCSGSTADAAPMNANASIAVNENMYASIPSNKKLPFIVTLLNNFYFG